MRRDLFSPREEPPAAPPRPLADVAFTGRRVATGKGDRAGFVHPCGRCGAAVAPFGFGVSLREAIRLGDGRRAGKWLCRACRDGGVE